MNILVTGSNGQLGLSIKNIAHLYPNYKFFFTDKEILDVTNFNAVAQYIEKNTIKIIINCAAYTNVDKAENEVNLAEKLNYLAVKNLAEIAKNKQLKLIHISTDYVFNGDNVFPYKEIDKVNPINNYGKSKLKGEKAIISINPTNSIIIRTSWLYSEFGSNFVKTIFKLSEEKEEIFVVNDQIGSPTYAKDLAAAILKSIPLLENDQVEIFHYSNAGKCSWFEFATEIVEITGKNCKVLPIKSEEINLKAKRPKYSLLSTKKIKNTFQIEIPNWKNSLKKCVLNLKNKTK